MTSKPTSKADVIIVGMGAVGGIMAKELATAGLNVVGFERGAYAEFEDYAYKDSMRAIIRRDLESRVHDEPVMRRPDQNSPAGLRYTTTPINAVGGGLSIWTGSATRFMPGDFSIYTNEITSGGAAKAQAKLEGYELFDWPIGYDDLEPYYEKFEYEMGVSGEAGANPFAGPRTSGYPLPPIRNSARHELFGNAAERLGYHPYQTPTGILSQNYQPQPPYDTRIPERLGCVYCGQCNNYGCHVQAKSSTAFTVIPVALETGNLDLRTHSKVFRIDTDAKGKVTGVSYFDANGRVQQQEASVVILGGYIYENARLLLLSGVGKQGLANSSGQVGRGIAAHGDIHTLGLFDDVSVNAFIGPNGGMRIDDFNGDNFDHAGIGFIRGGTIGSSGGGTPLERYDSIPAGWPRWGARYKENLAHYYTRSFEINSMPETLPHRENFVDLDPVRKDEWGIPLPRTTFTFHDNETRMWQFLGNVGEKIMLEAGASAAKSNPSRRPSRWTGGARMGNDPKTSVVNAYCQSHDNENLFVVGASVFPTMTGYAATPTVGALAYRISEYIAKKGV
jgi:gluconate 2-dehydrogenase alpha chain